ncbi:hypothetical protein DIPPA_18696 [Diplonema papillatum]|nr:hypothetical protein DIPPA_18696 [Diplonema papillatum]
MPFSPPPAFQLLAEATAPARDASRVPLSGTAPDASMSYTPDSAWAHGSASSSPLQSFFCLY